MQWSSMVTSWSKQITNWIKIVINWSKLFQKGLSGAFLVNGWYKLVNNWSKMFISYSNRVNLDKSNLDKLRTTDCFPKHNYQVKLDIQARKTPISHMLLLMLTFQLGLKTAANLYWAARVACGWHICCSFGMHGRNCPKKSPILFKKHKKTAFCAGGKTRKIKENKKLLAKQCFQMEMSIFWEVLKRHHRTHVLCPIDSSLVLIEHGYKATQINCTALIRAHIFMFILSSHIILFPPLYLCDEKEHNSNLYLLKIFPIHHMFHMQYLHILPSSTKLCLKVSDLQFY